MSEAFVNKAWDNRHRDKYAPAYMKERHQVVLK